MYRIHMARLTLYIPVIHYTAHQDQLPVCDTGAQAIRSSALQHVQLFLSEAHHQITRLPENQSLHIYLSRMVRYLTW